MRKPRISGIERIRTISSTKSRSIPATQRNAQIELYLLSKERERYEAEADRLEKRAFNVNERIKDIDREIQKLNEVWQSTLQRSEASEKETRSSRNKPANWKSKSVKY